MSRLSWFEPCHPAQLVAGLIIWSIWFVAMYAGLSTACLLTAPAQGAFNWINVSLFTLTLLVLALLLALAWRNGRYCFRLRMKRHGNAGFKYFSAYVSTVLYLAAAVATLAGGLPVLVFAPCS